VQLTLSQAAKEAGISKSTLSKALSTGRVSGQRQEDGSFRIDPSELFRVFPKRTPERGLGTKPVTVREQQETSGEQGGAEPLMLRLKVQLLEDQLARERTLRDQERETGQDTVNDLRKRLDRAEERVLALTVQPVPQPALEPSAVVEELRKRLQESEARNQMLSAVVAPQWPEERPSEPLAGVTPAKGARGFLGRLLGR
jgi:hypothetical protein